jgi:RNA polymerase sigma factor (sigma-70 family)
MHSEQDASGPAPAGRYVVDRGEVVARPDPVVFVVEDDRSLREAIKLLLETVDLRVETFRTAEQFLSSEHPDVPSCLVLDVRLPGVSGLELQRRMVRAGVTIPTVFITGHGDVPMSVQAMKAGAVEFLTKPFRDQQLLDAVQQALERDRVDRAHRAEQRELRQRLESLTAREREVMRLVLKGLLNKQIAGRLGTSEITVKVRRSRMMEKMQAQSLVDLARKAERLGLT